MRYSHSGFFDSNAAQLKMCLPVCMFNSAAVSGHVATFQNAVHL